MITGLDMSTLLSAFIKANYYTDYHREENWITGKRDIAIRQSSKFLEKLIEKIEDTESYFESHNIFMTAVEAKLDSIEESLGSIEDIQYFINRHRPKTED